jgi:hypothetical protein
MHQWLPAIERIADARGWRVITMLVSACPLARVPAAGLDGRINRTCAATNERRYRDLLRDPDIDVVVTSQRASHAALPGLDRAGQLAAMVADLRRTWADLAAAGRRVVVVLDNPSPPYDIIDCVATYTDRLSSCAFARAPAAAASGALAQQRALLGADGVGVVDVNDWICPAGTCPAVIGEVLVYRQSAHLTATYAATLAPRLDAALRAAMR